MLLDLVAIVLGILFSLRRLEIKRVPAPEDSTQRVAFETWQNAAMAAEALGVVVCFVKLVADLVVRLLAERGLLSPTLVQMLGASLFALWLGGLALAFVKRHRARKLAPPLTPTDASVSREEPADDENPPASPV